MKRTRRVKLTGRQTVMHYIPALTILVIPCLLYIALFSTFNKFFWGLAAFSCFEAIVYVRRQYRSLQFTEIPVRMNEEQFRKMFEDVSKQLHWIQEFTEEGHIVATTEFGWTNWGTLITLIRDKDVILANSICDLYKRPSTTSWGQNRKNIDTLKTYIAGEFGS